MLWELKNETADPFESTVALFFSSPGQIRTADRVVNSHLLYLTELPGKIISSPSVESC